MTKELKDLVPVSPNPLHPPPPPHLLPPTPLIQADVKDPWGNGWSSALTQVLQAVLGVPAFPPPSSFPSLLLPALEIKGDAPKPDHEVIGTQEIREEVSCSDSRHTAHFQVHPLVLIFSDPKEQGK